MRKNKESIAKGGSSVAVARLLGMVLSFLLFMVLARQSPAHAGVFRTVATYFVIAEFIGMLGMHRWLSTEITANPTRQWSIFLATNVVMAAVAVLLIVIYLGIAMSGFYSAEVSLGLKLATLSLIPSGVYQCVQCALVGIGRTYIVGVYNAAEYVIRCSLSIALTYFDHPVTDVIWVFVLSRWVVALFGFHQLNQILGAHKWKPSREDIQHVLHDAPRFLVIIAAFLALRNAALVLIPALVNDAEVAFYAVAYQLFDMILIIPSVLAISSNHVFVNKAGQSDDALRSVSIQFLSVTSIAMFPCIAITAAFAHNFLMLLYGAHYTIAQHALALLMLTSGVAMIDQVLSQIMTARKDYHSDMISILVGGLSAILLTYLLVPRQGATGAAIAFLIANTLTVFTRLYILREVFTIKLLWTNMMLPTISALVIFILCSYGLALPISTIIANSKYLWLACVPLALAGYALVLYTSGGISAPQREDIRKFLFHH